MRQAVIQKTEERQRRQQPNLTGIPTQMKMDFEQRSGLSFDDVRVHYNSDKPKRIGALAYTQIPQVHIGPGQERNLRHELGHVVQQKQGIVRPTTYINGLPVNDSPSMERSADRIASGITGQPVSEQINLTRSPIQLYSKTVIGGMQGCLSTRALFFLTEMGDLYASDEKIREANLILQHAGLVMQATENLTPLLKKVTLGYLAGSLGRMLENNRNLSILFARILNIPDFEKLEGLKAVIEEIFLEMYGKEEFNFEEASPNEKALVRAYANAVLEKSTEVFLFTDCKKLANTFFKGQTQKGSKSGTPGQIIQSAVNILSAVPIAENLESLYNYHYATIIMTDNTDYITIESCATPLYDMFKTESDSDPDSYKFEFDPFWSFNIYGANEQDFEAATRRLLRTQTSVSLAKSSCFADIEDLRTIFWDGRGVIPRVFLDGLNRKISELAVSSPSASSSSTSTSSHSSSESSASTSSRSSSGSSASSTSTSSESPLAPKSKRARTTPKK